MYCWCPYSSSFKFVCILVYLVQTFDLVLCWWQKVDTCHCSRASPTTKRSKIEYRVMADTSNHILCNMYMKRVKLHSLPIHWYYSYENTLELLEVEISPQKKIHIFFSSLATCNKMLLHTSIMASHDAHNMNFKLLMVGLFLREN